MGLVSEMREKVVLLILGWLFGLLGPTVVDAIRVRRTVGAIKRSLALELAELQIRVAGTTWSLAAYIGGVDRSFLEWLKAVHDRYRGVRGDTTNGCEYRADAKSIRRRNRYIHSAACRKRPFPGPPFTKIPDAGA
jgi:hypothetical protein